MKRIEVAINAYGKNPKSEARNPKQIRNPNVPMFKTKPVKETYLKFRSFEF